MKPGSLLRVVLATAVLAIAAAGVGGGALPMMGCMAAGDSNDGADPVTAPDQLQAARRASIPETGAPIGAPSAAAVCKVCAIASSCCEAVGGGPECTFSANSCSTAPSDAARQTYADRCETFVKNIFGVWRQTPPPECL
jgi:hypothetical protein